MTPRLRVAIEALFLGTVLFATALFAPQTMLLTAVQLFCLLYASHTLAPAFFPEHATAPRLFLATATFLGLQSVLQTVIYYLLPSLGLFTDIATQILATTMLYAALWFLQEDAPLADQSEVPTTRKERFFLYGSHAAFYTLAFIGTFFVLSHARGVATTLAIRTPWAILPQGTILAFLFIVSSLWLFAWWRRSSTHAWIVSSLFFLTLALITVLVYPLGFGFDGFLHRESERLLLTTGTLHPKPLYYIGQYALATWLARTLNLSIQMMDTLLLAGIIPLLTATLALRRSHRPRQEIGVLILALVLLVPLRPWITATPQSLAYLIGLSGLLLASVSSLTARSWPALILGVWSVAIHPLAGLPLLGGIVLTLWRSTFAYRPMVRFVGSLVATLGIALVVPLAFFLNSHAGTQVTWHLQDIISLDRLRTLKELFISPALRISFFADWANFVEFLAPLLLVLFAVLGSIRKKKSASSTESLAETSRPSSSWLTAAGLLTILVAWFMQQAATFAFLIDYERQDYTARLILVGQLLLIPAAMQGFATVWQRVQRGPALVLWSFLLLAMAWQSGRIYRAFPYHDATHIEHGWNVSAADKEAVRWIDRDAGNEPYTVLADQSVSAAAISELGFKRYVGDVFFYPVPTGGPLYQVFLRATSRDVSMDDLRKAAALGESKRVYVVLNSYWWQANDVANRLSSLMGEGRVFGQGDVRVYRLLDASSAINR